MNKEYILYNLKDASKQILDTIKDIESDKEYEYGEFIADMMHLYHHINTAWNARDASESQVNECSESDFIKWRQFPSNDEIYLGE